MSWHCGVALSTLVPSFVPLHVKSGHSLGLGTASIASLVQHAGRAGFTHVGLTDVENVYAQVQFHAACRAAGLCAITGVELRAGVVARRALGQRAGRLVIIAADTRGYASLCRIVTRRRTRRAGSADGAGGAPARTRDSAGIFGDTVENIVEDIVEDIVGDGAPLADGADGAFWLSDDVRVLAALVRTLGPRSVRALLVRPRPLTPETELVATARRLGVALVADVDATVLNDADAALQHLICAAHLATDVETARSALDGDAGRPLLAPEAIAASFADVPEALRETRALAEACTLDLLGLPPVRHADGVEHRRELERRCRERLEALAVREPARARQRAERLASELAMIERLGLADLFTSVAALIDAAQRRDIPVAARGSAVGSFAGHLLGFTPIDPVAQGLFFERFAGAARRSPPDIDLDVASQRRDELIDWLIETRGPSVTARLSSLVAFRPRSAHRAGLRALGAPRDVVERWLGRFPPDELSGAMPFPAPHFLPEPWRAHRALLDGLIGMPRHLALHPGGVALSASPLTDRVPLEQLASGATVTQYDAASLARIGCVKVDLLGSHALDEISATLAEVRRRSDPPAWALRSRPDASAGVEGAGAAGVAVCVADDQAGGIPLDDAATLASIDRAETIGCFQLESPALRAVLAQMPVRSVADVAHALAIVRPGPASGHAKELFLARARGELAAPSLSELGPSLRERLRATHGVLLYEEDILCLLAELGDLPLETAEALRARLVERADDPGWVERAGRRFLERARSRGVEPPRAERAWADVLRFASYSFNQAHTLSQALLGYRVAFLKTHAPLELGRALLDHHAGLYPRRVIAAELVRRGIPLLPPSLASSERACSIQQRTAGGALRVGLGLIARLRSATCDRILGARAEGALTSVADLLLRVRPEPRELRALVESGAADDLFGLGPNDYPWVHDAVLTRLERDDPGDIPRAIAEARERLPRDPAALVDRYRRLCRVQRELQHLGMHLSGHPMQILRADADRLGCIPSHRLGEHAGARVPFAALIAAARRVPFADVEGAPLRGPLPITQFITLEDEHGLVEGRLSTAAHARLHGTMTTPGPYLLHARVCDQRGALYLDVDDLLPFHRRDMTGS